MLRGIALSTLSKHWLVVPSWQSLIKFWFSASATPTPVVHKRNIIDITISYTGDDLDATVDEFAGELETVLSENGMEDAMVKIIYVSADDKEKWV